MAPILSNGQYLMRLLKAYGVDTVFGIPGVHTLELYRGIASEGMAHVLVRHEQGAGFMADGYARASGKPGVCTLITGPGLANALTPIGQAFSDSVPMLVLASVNARADLGRGWGRLHEITDQGAMVAPLCGLMRTANDADEIRVALAEAFTLFGAQRPRPATIQLPIDVLGAESGAIGPFETLALPTKPRVAATEIERAAQALAAARRPVILAGGGALGAAGRLAPLAERLGAPVIVTVAGKGLIADRHPLSLGATLPFGETRALLAAADFVLVLGSELAETDHWQDRLEINGRIVRVDLDPRKHTDLYPAAQPLLGDAAAAAADLLAALGAGQGAGWDGAAAARVAEARGAIDAWQAREKAPFMAALKALRAGLPANGIVASDMTQLAYVANAAFPVDRPRSYLHPVGFGTLGYGLPAAIGAKLGAPERPVVAMVGDGGLLFTLTELATAVELEQPLAVLLWDNDGLGQIRDDMIRRQMPQIGVSPRNPDFLALARGFGAAAVDLASPGDLPAALATAFAARQPTVIRLRADRC